MQIIFNIKFNDIYLNIYIIVYIIIYITGLKWKTKALILVDIHNFNLLDIYTIYKLYIDRLVVMQCVCVWGGGGGGGGDEGSAI